MSTQLDLEQIERRAFRSTYQDGLWDIYYGLMLMAMAIFMFRPPDGYSAINIFLALGGFCLSYLLFWLGKKYITLPRMGQVKFSEARERRRRTLSLVLGAIVLIQVIFILFTVFAWLNSGARDSLNDFMKDREIMDLVVAFIGASFVGSGMLLVAYYRDFPRGYYIAISMMLAVFLMIYLNQPIYPILIGVLVILPGIILLVRFLRKYPQPGMEVDDERF